MLGLDSLLVRKRPPDKKAEVDSPRPRSEDGSANASSAGACAFGSPPASSYFWDVRCQADGGVGCLADGVHPECRWCGSGPYPPCPAGSTPAPAPEPACTAAGGDPWANGTHTDCCEGLAECLGWHEPQRRYYLCLPACSQNSTTQAPQPWGWQPSGKRVGSGWCRAEAPVHGWSLKRGCDGATRVKVLTYNLFWWNLFEQRGGNDNSAGRLIAEHGPFDILAFQECEDAARVLRGAGLASSHAVVNGGHATAIAYDKSAWELLDSGREDIAEDRPDQWYGRRGVVWVRLRHRASGKVVFAANTHGPLPVNSGGLCGGQATAYNLLRTFGQHAGAGDVKILLGDLNADADSAAQRSLQAYLHRAAHHWVDAIFGSCPGEAADNLGSGGSDHDAIEAVFRI